MSLEQIVTAINNNTRAINKQTEIISGLQKSIETLIKKQDGIDEIKIICNELKNVSLDTLKNTQLSGAVAQTIVDDVTCSTQHFSCIPFKNTDEFVKFDNNLESNKEIRLAFRNFLKSIGSKTSTTKFMTDRLTKLFANGHTLYWAAFQKTNTFKILSGH